MQGKAPQGTKKSKDQIAKAANQKKGGVKVLVSLIFRNGPREKQKKNLNMPSSLTRPLMTESSPVSPSWEDTSQSQVSLKNIKFPDLLLVCC